MSQNDVTMTVQRLDKMIEVLEHARIRPGMYFGLHPSSYHNFIRGFEMSRAILFDIQGFDEVYDETLQEHGFRKILPCDLYMDLLHLGVSSRDAMRLHLEVLIATYKKLRDQIAAPQNE